jgi:hypothetical protein
MHSEQDGSSGRQSPTAQLTAGRRGLVAQGGVALAIALWIFGFKLRAFLGLGTTSDLYQFVQLCTSWIHGPLLYDNCYGFHLAIHTYLLCPLLAPLVVPLGAVGLLIAVAAAAGLGCLAAVRLLRALEVPPAPALAVAAASTLMPLSVHVYQDAIYGFHVELLLPAMMLWLAGFLVQRRWLASLLMAAATLALKEDATLAVALTAALIAAEDLLRGSSHSGGRQGRWNRPALVVMGLGVAVLPLLLWIIRTEAAAHHVISSFDRLHPVENNRIEGTGSLLHYAGSHVFSWLGSPGLRQWLLLAPVATFGFVIFRPHLLVLGSVTTLICWLMQDDLLWAPRFAAALGFFQIVTCLGAAGACRWLRRRGAQAPARTTRWLWAGISVVTVLSVGRQLAVLPDSLEVYRLRPQLALTPEDRSRADRLFAAFRRDSKPTDTVVASDYLFRYAHDRNLLWYSRLAGKPAPDWLLWDGAATPELELWTLLRTDLGDRYSDYDLIARDGRFLLYRRAREAGRKSGRVLPDAALIQGTPLGAVHLRAQFSGAKVGRSEPLLSEGTNETGEIFFVRYLDATHLAIGFESLRLGEAISEPVVFDSEQTHDLTLFSTSLIPRPPAEAANANEALRRYYSDVVIVRWDGREILRQRVPHHDAPFSAAYVGCNLARATTADLAFRGRIMLAEHVKLPDTMAAARPFEANAGQAGPVMLHLRLPGAAAGVPEPLLTVGVPGKAVLAYVRVLAGGRIRVGAEIWGVGAYETEPLPADSSQPVDIAFSVPAFYPGKDDPWWQQLKPEARQHLSTSLIITVNQTIALDRAIKMPAVDLATLRLGENPIGGSLVYPHFTGEIIQAFRLPSPDH